MRLSAAMALIATLRLRRAIALNRDYRDAGFYNLGESLKRP
jgi:hypothetical protein